jgi:hypothetical protein
MQDALTFIAFVRSAGNCPKHVRVREPNWLLITGDAWHLERTSSKCFQLSDFANYLQG